MRIFYITTTVHLSRELKEAIGATTHTLSVAKELQKLGHELHIVTERFEGDPQYEEIGGLHIYRMLRGGGLVSSRKIKRSPLSRLLRPFKIIPYTFLGLKVSRLMSEHGCDAIIERGHSLGVGAVASVMTGKPLMLEVIDHIFSRLSLWRAQSIIAYTKAFFPAKYHDRVTLVDAGYDPAYYFPVNVEKSHDIVYVGAFKEWDGLEDLVAAAKHVVKERPGTTFKLVGEGARSDEIAALIEEHGLKESFSLVGRVPMEEVRHHLSSGRIGVAPFNVKLSPKGNFQKYGFYFAPLKIFEYMSCGLPIVTTDYPIIAAVVGNDNGRLVPEGGQEALANALLELLREPDARNRIAVRNLELAQQYTWTEVVKQIDAELQRIA